MREELLRTCTRGHRFLKKTDCPTCPICAAEDKPDSGFLALLAAPARRALSGAGITTLKELAKHNEGEILRMHGVGLKTIKPLRKALADAGLKFSQEGMRDIQ
jgi:predicted RecB family nuclease